MLPTDRKSFEFINSQYFVTIATAVSPIAIYRCISSITSISLPRISAILIMVDPLSYLYHREGLLKPSIFCASLQYLYSVSRPLLLKRTRLPCQEEVLSRRVKCYICACAHSWDTLALKKKFRLLKRGFNTLLRSHSVIPRVMFQFRQT